VPVVLVVVAMLVVVTVVVQAASKAIRVTNNRLTRQYLSTTLGEVGVCCSCFCCCPRVYNPCYVGEWGGCCYQSSIVFSCFGSKAGRQCCARLYC
jgi:hypothetical protein